MKPSHLFISILILFIFSSCDEEYSGKVHIAQLDNINQMGEGKPKIKSTGQLFSGVAFNTYFSGEPYWEINFKNGIKHGEEKYYFNSGELAKKSEYNNGHRIGVKTEYFKSGHIESETVYGSNGIQIRYSAWDENTGVKISNYKYDKNGILISGARFYPNGRKKWKAECKNGVIIKETRWYENKQIEKEYEYDEKGDPISKKTFYSNGSPIKKEGFQKNIRHGEYIEYYRNGNIQRIGYFHLGIRDGEFKRFFEDGSLMSEAVFKMGIPKSQAVYDSSGKKVSDKFIWTDPI